MVEFNFPTLFTRKLVAEYEQRCYPDGSRPLVFQYRDRPPAYQILGEFQEIKPLIKQLGAPTADNAVFCVRWSSAAEFFKQKLIPPRRFLNYSIERFGLRVQPFPIGNSQCKTTGDIKNSSRFLTQPRYWFERENYLVQVWRTRIFAYPIKDIRSSLSNPISPFSLSTQSMHLEERWHYCRGTARTLYWLEPRDNRRREVDQFMCDALRILDGFKPIGRPAGTRKFNSPDEFTIKYRQAYLALARRKADPTHEEVATELGISLSTFNRRLREYHLPFPPNLT